MNEQDLKQAFHDVMVASSPPPSMDPSRALGAAHKARSRRRATWAGALVAVAVVGVGVGAALVVPTSGGPSPSLQMGNGSSAPSVTPTAPPTTRKSGDPWPEGQTDRTQTSGPRADKAVAMMNDLGSSLPQGFTAPDLKYPDGRAMRWPQAQYGSADGEVDYWEYLASIPVKKDAGVGRLLVQSTTPNGKPAEDPCAAAQKFWGMPGDCTTVDVGGKKVGVVTKNTSGRNDFDQWAFYRHEDGTSVVVAQALQISDGIGSATHPALTQPVFTTQQLAELATSEKFKVS